LKKVISHL